MEEILNSVFVEVANLQDEKVEDWRMGDSSAIEWGKSHVTF